MVKSEGSLEGLKMRLVTYKVYPLPRVLARINISWLKNLLEILVVPALL